MFTVFLSEALQEKLLSNHNQNTEHLTSTEIPSVSWKSSEQQICLS
jgi:hypothetical protein